jgi:nucleoside-diphosphate-sugar epimerase
MGKVAIVTGGTRGIGRAIAETLKNDGFTVVANYAGNEEKAKAFTDESGIAAYKWDVGDYDACMAGCEKVAAEVGPVDVVVNNAGITRDGTLLKMSYDDWNEVMRINLGGCFNMAKACFPGMKERGWGRVVNIGSINGQAGQYGQVNYAAAKSGIHGFTKALAQRHRARLYRHRHGRRGAGAGARENRRQDSGRPARPGRGDRARGELLVQRERRLRHGLHHEHQRRPAHVLTKGVNTAMQFFANGSH